MKTERDVQLIDLGDAREETKTPLGPVSDGVGMGSPLAV